METIHVKFDKLTAMASEHNCLEPGTNRFQDNDSSAADASIPSKEDLDNLFDQEAPPIVSSLEEHLSLILCNDAVESVQEDSVEFDGNTLFTPYDALTFEEAKSSSIAKDPSNMHEFHQVQPSTHIWTKAHPLEQVIDDPSKPVMTRNRLHTNSKRLDVWELVPRPTNRNVIAAKWLWKNKCDVENIVIHNKSRLVAKGYKQEEGINFKESFAPVARLEEARYSLHIISRPCLQVEEISILSQASSESMKHMMDESDFMSTPMATARLDADLQGNPTDQTKYHNMIRGLMYLTASRPNIAFATFSYNMVLWYAKDFSFELIAYPDADHAGCHDDCKSTSRGLQFLGEKLNSSWHNHNKQRDVPQDQICPPNKKFDLRDANKKFDLVNPQCPNESKILADILNNHPLRTCGQQLVCCSLGFLLYQNSGLHWRSKLNDLKFKFKFVLDTKELTMTVADFRRIFRLPQATDNNHAGFVDAPTFSQMVPFFYNVLSFFSIIEIPSNLTTSKNSSKSYENVGPKKQALIDVEEAIQIILTGIDNDIYSTVYACDSAKVMCRCA
ncbi:retrovirus-related pol polyprotein from transposon TNT 1-94 [Tanacetum coccineum]